jgi:hypothetical protein
MFPTEEDLDDHLFEGPFSNVASKLCTVVQKALQISAAQLFSIICYS